MPTRPYTSGITQKEAGYSNTNLSPKQNECSIWNAIVEFFRFIGRFFSQLFCRPSFESIKTDGAHSNKVGESFQRTISDMVKEGKEVDVSDSKDQFREELFKGRTDKPIRNKDYRRQETGKRALLFEGATNRKNR